MNKFLSVALLLFLLLSSCSQPFSEEALIGKWKSIEVTFNIDGLSPAILETTREIILSTTFDFKTDHQLYSVASDAPEGKDGAWKMEGDILNLYFKNSPEEVINFEEPGLQYKVTHFTGDKMSLFYDYEKLGDLTIHLEKE